MLPPGSIIINRPKSFCALHPVWVWGVLIFILCQSAAIVLLLVQQRRRLKAERALATHARQLARSNYMLEQFAQVTAHDFQEPIRTVAVCTELVGRSVRGKLDAESAGLRLCPERRAAHARHGSKPGRLGQGCR